MMGGWIGGNLFGSRPNYHYFIDDLDEVHASIRKILSGKPARLYVGHGGPLQADAVQKYFSQDNQH
jgi:hydroxyacylglutathione hydrolase